MKGSRKLSNKPSPELWLSTQVVEKERYERDYRVRGNYDGHFAGSISSVTAAIRARLEVVAPRILDVGCGILRHPQYLSESEVFGIDPYQGEERDFFFAQGVGENLPFMSSSFNAVLLMSSLDHVLDPAKVLSESHRVLKLNGEIFIWFISRNRIDPHHPWSFNAEELIEFMSSWFTAKERHVYGPDKAVGYPRTMMVVGVKK